MEPGALLVVHEPENALGTFVSGQRNESAADVQKQYVGEGILVNNSGSVRNAKTSLGIASPSNVASSSRLGVTRRPTEAPVRDTPLRD